MNILLTAATFAEIAPFLKHLDDHWQREAKSVYRQDRIVLQVVVTGVGCTATAFALGYFFSQAKPDIALNAGVAGALDPLLSPGEVVSVVRESFADLGAEDRDGSFLDIFEMGLLSSDTLPFKDGVLSSPKDVLQTGLREVEGITVNTVHGCQSSIDAVKLRYPEAAVESMEGAAFFYSCLIAEVPFLQVRSISNAVEPRDRSRWQLPLAIDHLDAALRQITDSFT